MRLQPTFHTDLATPSGPMRTHFFAPLGQGAYPGIVLFSEIYQMTGPIARTAAFVAGHGFVVAVPEVYHEFAAPGEVFPYDQQGTERGNQLKITKPLANYDADAVAVLEHLKTMPCCNGILATFGICLGGHLALRAAMNPDVASAVCCYATDIHKASLGKEQADDTLKRMHEVKGELLMIWGRQDPHIPNEGRRIIYDAFMNSSVPFEWHEFNGEHAFLRDEGHRYDPSLASLIYPMIFELFRRTLKN